MKRQFNYTICAAAMLLAACAKDNAPQPAPDTGAQLSIAIFDGGYVPADGVTSYSKSGATASGTPVTRAAENGYATQFTAGDACGLYIVSGGTVTVANVRLTASAGYGDAVVWTPDASAGTLWHIPGDRYFVYYPWQATPQGAPTAGQTVDADDDAAFFAELIAAWEPAADQSHYAAGYTASDLMTAEAVIGSPAGGSMPLLFEMTHRMALAVVEMPRTTAVAAEFSGEAQPCRMADHTYRYLVNPAAPTVPTLEGIFDNGTTKGFSIVPSGIAGGSYKTYKVDGGSMPENGVQVGDYFYSDGSCSTELDPNKTVIGIVFQSDPARIGTAEKEALRAKGVIAPRGLVLALKNAGEGITWSTTRADEDLINCELIEQNDKDISGYGNCKLIRATYGGFDNYPAFAAADAYNTSCPAPATTTGWYLPASGQWYDILLNLGGLADWDAAEAFVGDYSWSLQKSICTNLNKWMSDVADADQFNDSNDFWSSSEFSNENARYWNINSSGSVNCYWNSKGMELGVRAVLAF